MWDDGAMTAMRAISATVTGRVQGVGFRYSTVARAQALGIDGWVRNTVRGAVEVHAQGDREAMDRFVTFLRTGPQAARVEGVTILEVSPNPNLSGFTVRA